MPTYISIADAAARMHVSAWTVRRRIAEGALTGYRFGPRLIRLDVAEVDAVLRPMANAVSGENTRPLAVGFTA